LDDKSSRTHRYLEIQERIQQDIRHLPPHTRLLSRIDMVKKYGVTRTTIEKAVSELVGKGVVYNAIGSGTFVAERAASGAGAGVASGTAWRTWGVVLPSITDDFYPEIVRGIQDVAQEQRCHVVLLNSDHLPEKQHQAIEQLLQSGLQGAIIVPAITKIVTAPTFRKLQERGVPFVFCNRTVEGVEAPKVVSNNFFGAFLAARHVLRQGFRRLAFIGGPMYSVLEQRYQGFLGALQEEGIVPDPAHVSISDEWDHRSVAFRSASGMLEQQVKPDAFVCFNDMAARGVYDAAAAAGLRVGQDVAVIGYGDTKLCEALPVKLTSIRYPAYQAGRRAAEMLVQATQSSESASQSSIVLQPELVVRASC
jgi:DNA-binding LacI/PurR family transcriptional regulator